MIKPNNNKFGNMVDLGKEIWIEPHFLYLESASYIHMKCSRHS